tara:strand:- start:340 stop:513 length:174 start_codon:yes stop_codon:yes gene_type:complete
MWLSTENATEVIPAHALQFAKAGETQDAAVEGVGTGMELTTLVLKNNEAGNWLSRST